MSDWNEGACYAASFSIHKSRRYHAKMRAFYRGCYDLTTAATAITGSGAFVALIGSPGSDQLAKWLTGIVALSSTMNLVFGFAKKADIHDALCRRFTELAAKLEEWPATEESLQRARAERLAIEKDEPTEKRLVDLQARNEEARARNCHPDDLVPLSWAQYWLGYVATFGIRRLEKWKAKRDRERTA